MQLIALLSDLLLYIWRNSKDFHQIYTFMNYALNDSSLHINSKSASWVTGPDASRTSLIVEAWFGHEVIVESNCPFLQPSFMIWLDFGDVISRPYITVTRLLRVSGQCQSDVDLLAFGDLDCENVFMALLLLFNSSIVGLELTPTYSGWLRRLIVLLLL